MSYLNRVDFIGFKDVVIDLLNREEIEYTICDKFRRGCATSQQWITFNVNFNDNTSGLPKSISVQVHLNQGKRGFLVDLIMYSEPLESVESQSFITCSAYDLVKVIHDARMQRIGSVKEWVKGVNFKMPTPEELGEQ